MRDQTSYESRCPLCEFPLSDPAITGGRDKLLGLGGSFTVRECRRCELGVTTPRPTTQELERHYPDEYGPYREPEGLMRQAIERSRRARADAVIRRDPFSSLVASRSSGRVLDVGCGRGDVAAAFVRHGWTAHGLDPSPNAVERARDQGVEATVGSLADAPHGFRDYDLVIFNHSLEHVSDPTSDLVKARELLKRGGHVVVALPDWTSWQRHRYGSAWFHLDLPRHLYHFSPHALRILARRAGLTPRDLTRTTSLVGLIGSVQYRTFGRCIARGRWLRLGLAVAYLCYPGTLLVGRTRGGDTLCFVAERSDGTAPRGHEFAR